MQKQKLLHRQVSDILWRHWDPIGISDVPECRDEYDTYAWQVLRLVLNSAPPTEIRAYLEKVSRENIGIDPDPTCIEADVKLVLSELESET